MGEGQETRVKLKCILAISVSVDASLGYSFIPSSKDVKSSLKEKTSGWAEVGDEELGVTCGEGEQITCWA